MEEYGISSLGFDHLHSVVRILQRQIMDAAGERAKESGSVSRHGWTLIRVSDIDFAVKKLGYTVPCERA